MCIRDSYSDERYIASMEGVGIPPEDARDYGFGLCQDVLIPGRGDHYCSGGVNLTMVLLQVIRQHPDANSYGQLKDCLLYTSATPMYRRCRRWAWISRPSRAS